MNSGLGDGLQYGFYVDIQSNKSIGKEELNEMNKNIEKLIKQNIPIEVIENIDNKTKNIFIKDNSNNNNSNKLVEMIKINNTIYLLPNRTPILQNISQLAIIRLLSSSAIESSSSSAAATDNNLYRIYGIGYPTKDLYTKWKTILNQSKDMDHRILGPQLHLFMFNNTSPGSPFLLPRGTIIFNRLINYLRKEYKLRDYSEVITPQLYYTSLWEKSGHLQNYSDDMFFINKSIDEQIMGLKPMNCPAHCLIYQSEVRSYRDLPIKLADFSPLHRNERSGALTGMTRVRRFHQDDAHIFTSIERLENDIKECIDFVDNVYKKFNLTYTVMLSTKPEKKFIGESNDWERAENILITVLNHNKIKYVLNKGDGAFYGPKLDFIVNDNLNRKHQLATIQIDFQFPKRFDLTYKTQDSKVSRPIILHRAILGSIERFIAILIEHYKGRFPFFISPYQMMLLPINSSYLMYCKEIKRKLEVKFDDLVVDVDDSDKSLNKRIRNSEMLHYNYIGVIGDKEIKNNTLTIRNGRNNDLKNYSFEELCELVKKELS